MNERKSIENQENASKDQKEEKADKSKEFGKKPAKLLVEGIIAAFAVVTFSSCTPLVNSMLKKPVDEGVDNVEESDEIVELTDSEEDMSPEEVNEIVETESVLEEETAEIVEDVEEEKIEVIDEDVDVAEEVGEIEEIPDLIEDEVVICNASDTEITGWINVGVIETVGGIGIKYNGLDGDGNGLYDVLCGDVTVRSGIVAAPLTSEMVDVPEHSFSVTLRPNTVDATHSNVTVTVDAY